MPMYYFCLCSNDDVSDVDGTELPDLDAARHHAGQVARELMFNRDGMLQRSWSQWSMSVRDSTGRELMSFALMDFKEMPLKDCGHPLDSSPTSAKKRP